MENEVDSDLYDIVLDVSWLSNAITAQMQLDGGATSNEFFTIEHLEIDGEMFNIIARKHVRQVN